MDKLVTRDPSLVPATMDSMFNVHVAHQDPRDTEEARVRGDQEAFKVHQGHQVSQDHRAKVACRDHVDSRVMKAQMAVMVLQVPRETPEPREPVVTTDVQELLAPVDTRDSLEYQEPGEARVTLVAVVPLVLMVPVDPPELLDRPDHRVPQVNVDDRDPRVCRETMAVMVPLVDPVAQDHREPWAAQGEQVLRVPRVMLATPVTRVLQVSRVVQEREESVVPSVLLVQLVVMDDQEFPGKQENRAHKVLVVLQVPQVLQDPRALLAQLATTEYRVTLVSLDSVVQREDRDPREPLVAVESQARLDVTARLDLLEPTVFQGHPEPRDHQETVVAKVHQDNRVLLD